MTDQSALLQELARVVEPLNTSMSMVNDRMRKMEHSIEEMKTSFSARHTEVDKVLSGSAVDNRPGLANEHRQVREAVASLQAQMSTLLSQSTSQDKQVNDVLHRLNHLADDLDKLREAVRKLHDDESSGSERLSRMAQEQLIRWAVPFVMSLIGLGLYYLVQRGV